MGRTVRIRVRVAPSCTECTENCRKTRKQQKRLKQLREREKEWSGREDLNLRPLVPNCESQNSKCFIWCRLGTGEPFFLSLSCTEVVPRIWLLTSTWAFLAVSYSP